MSSFIGHALTGVISKQRIKTELQPEKERLLYILAAAAALLPDLDVLFFILIRPDGMLPHRGFSHSLLFAVLAAALLTALTRKAFPVPRLRLFLVYLVPLLAHLALDYLMGAGPRVPFFAPFSYEGFLAPVRLVPCAFYSRSIDGLFGLLTTPIVLIGFALDALIFAPIAFFLAASGDTPKGRLIKKISLIITALALMATFYLYNFVFFRP